MNGSLGDYRGCSGEFSGGTSLSSGQEAFYGKNCEVKTIQPYEQSTATCCEAQCELEFGASTPSHRPKTFTTLGEQSGETTEHDETLRISKAGSAAIQSEILIIVCWPLAPRSPKTIF